jgi:SAM-dependent methyltransferase
VNTGHRHPFDAYAADYDAALDEALSISGETKSFFARGRVHWLARCLKRRGRIVQTAMDFGCGTGSSVPLFLDMLGARTVIGVDPSPRLLDAARRMYQSERASFLLPSQYTAESRVDLVYCNGVFHHIPETDRSPALAYIYHALRPGALFSFWENNPWNPGTRYIMRRLPFDRDAQTLSYLRARRLLHASGFQLLESSFLFLFPRPLRVLRPLERFFSRVPIGGQYHILCMKPE